MISQQLALTPEAPYSNDGAQGLPLITNHVTHAIKVYTPGHLYIPSPLKIDGIGKAAGALIKTEAEFIAALIRYLDPNHAQDENVAKRIPTAIKRDQREYFLLRNLDRSPDGTRFRLEAGNWFYPDFIFWIVDKSTQPETQRLCYLDPKGLEMGVKGGWSDHKLLCFIYKLVEIASQIPVAHNQHGQPVQFILKGALISTTTYQALKTSAGNSDHFRVYDNAGHRVFPSVDDFAKGGIFFAEKANHIERLMTYLQAGESVLDQVMRCAVTVLAQPETAIPHDEVGCFFRCLLRDNKESVAGGLGELVRYALTAGDLNQVISRIQQHSRKELLPYLHKGMLHQLTGGMEDVNRIVQPCREWLQRSMA